MAGVAPYFMALSLWMGAVMTTFVFHFIKLPESNRAHPYLPVSNMVDALRASLLGAYQGHWGYYSATV